MLRTRHCHTKLIAITSGASLARWTKVGGHFGVHTKATTSTFVRKIDSIHVVRYAAQRLLDR
jgi:hypothetical protein